MIKLLFTLLLIIPLSASILLLFVLLLCKILKSYCSQFIFFLLKVGLFISIIPNFAIAQTVFRIYSKEKTFLLTYSEDFWNTIFVKDISLQWQSEIISQISTILVFAWIIINMVIIGKKLYKQHNTKKSFLDNSTRAYEDEEMVRTLSKRLDIKTPIDVYKSNLLKTALTIGVFHSYILLPEKWEDYKQEEKENILKHELIHCKRKDLLFKEISFILTAIYWYNPIMAFYNTELSFYSELACDEKIVEKYSSEYKTNYGRTFVKVATQNSNLGPDDTMSFAESNDLIILKRRLDNIMKASIKKMRRIGVAAITMTLITASTLISYAASSTILKAEDAIADYMIEENQTEKDSFEELTEAVEIPAGEEAVLVMSLDSRGVTELELPLDKGITACIEDVSLKTGDSIAVFFDAESSSDKFYVGVGTETDDMVYVVSSNGSVTHRFVVPKDGTYSVRVKNPTSHSIVVTGYVIVSSK